MRRTKVRLPLGFAMDPYIAAGESGHRLAESPSFFGRHTKLNHARHTITTHNSILILAPPIATHIVLRLGQFWGGERRPAYIGDSKQPIGHNYFERDFSYNTPGVPLFVHQSRHITSKRLDEQLLTPTYMPYNRSSRLRSDENSSQPQQFLVDLPSVKDSAGHLQMLFTTVCEHSLQGPANGILQFSIPSPEEGVREISRTSNIDPWSLQRHPNDLSNKLVTPEALTHQA